MDLQNRKSPGADRPPDERPEETGLDPAGTSGVAWENETTPNLTLFIKEKMRQGDVLSEIYQRLQTEGSARAGHGRVGGGGGAALRRQPAADIRMATERSEE